MLNFLIEKDLKENAKIKNLKNFINLKEFSLHD